MFQPSTPGSGIRRPQPTNDEYMRSASEQAFRQFRTQSGEGALARRLEQKVQSRFEVLRYSAGPVFSHDDLQQGNVLAEHSRDGGLEVLWLYTLFHRIVMWCHLTRDGGTAAGLPHDLEEMCR